MLALLGERSTRLFPAKSGISRIVAPFSVDYESFFENYYRNVSSVILDRSCVDFSLDHMKGVLIFEVLESLRCKRKLLEANEKATIVKKEKIFSRGNFSIQNVAINDLQLFQKIVKNTSIRDVFMIEQAICELCKSVAEINDKTWWLYVAEHKSGGIKITAGLGNGVVYSRSFFNVDETERKIKGTLKYLVREGIDENVKIISFIKNDISIDGVEILTPVIPQLDLEIALVDIILNRNKNVVPNFSKDNSFRRFLAEKDTVILSIFATSIAICCLFLWHCYDFSADLKNVIRIEKDKLNIFTKDASKTLFVRVKEDNFEGVKKFVDFFGKIRNPLILLGKISKILKGKDIEELQIEKEGVIVKIKMVLDASELRDLKNMAKDQNYGIELKLLTPENGEIIEDSRENQKYSVEICIKMN